MATIDQQFVEYVVKSLVEHPDDVVVDRVIDEKGVLLTLTVIGRRGSTAQSLRTLLRALGTKNSARYNLKVVNNDEPHTAASQSVDNLTTDTVDNDDESESDFAKKSRQELAELDDLDI